MDNFFSKIRGYYYYIPYILITFYMIYKYYINYNTEQVSLDYWLVRGNFIPLVSNTAFFYARYKYINIKLDIRDFTITRIGEDAFENSLLKVGLLNALLYTFFTHLLLVILFYYCVENFYTILLNGAINFIIFFLFECLYVNIILNRKNSALALLPVLLNLVIHYFIVLPYIY